MIWADSIMFLVLSRTWETFCKRPRSQYFRLCTPRGLCCNYSARLLDCKGSHRQNAKEWEQLSSNNTLFTKPANRSYLAHWLYSADPSYSRKGRGCMVWDAVRIPLLTFFSLSHLGKFLNFSESLILWDKETAIPNSGDLCWGLYETMNECKVFELVCWYIQATYIRHISSFKSILPPQDLLHWKQVYLSTNCTALHQHQNQARLPKGYMAERALLSIFIVNAIYIYSYKI